MKCRSGLLPDKAYLLLKTLESLFSNSITFGPVVRNLDWDFVYSFDIIARNFLSRIRDHLTYFFILTLNYFFNCLIE